MNKIFNFKTIKDPFAPLPEDRYLVEVVDVQQTLNKNDDIMFNIRFKVLKPEEFANRVLWANMSLGDDSISFFKRFLDAVGSTLTDGEDVTPDQIVPDLIGRKATCFVQIGKIPGTEKLKNELRHWEKTTEENIDLLS